MYENIVYFFLSILFYEILIESVVEGTSNTVASLVPVSQFSFMRFLLKDLSKYEAFTSNEVFDSQFSFMRFLLKEDTTLKPL